MNILPKKRWHVRTKENIARVRRDEALAAEEARIEQARIDKAESEARLNLLRAESRKKSGSLVPASVEEDSKVDQNSSKSSKHINFFEELERGNIDHSRTNKDYEKDKKEEQEKYEKQIGYLTYLGQGIKEAVSKSWYNEVPRRLADTEKDVEIKPNRKLLEDPLQDIRGYMKIISLKQGKDEWNQVSRYPDFKTEKLEPRVKIENNSFGDVKIFSKGMKRKMSSSSSADDSSECKPKSHKKHKKDKKHRKRKKHKKDKERNEVQQTFDIEKLRAERIEREKRERLRTQALLAEVKQQSRDGESNPQPTVKQKYNSQFFPQLARQNCEKSHR
ncbi:hypothetical protein QAD02_001770 [Eretmocerus hayati]|uniref:Uncharacterized protein n=1 Tax=Eretmocerus hayati TaxID=131215 RepID=A0ACC2NIR1_9HYME|nr:hypothetical protein QAD02_001770 [Eretmocerus hayati]